MTWYTIRAKAAKTAEVWIYGDIGESWSDETVTARQFVSDLAKVDATSMTVRINSLGGSVPDGLAIYNAIRRHPADVTVAIDGVAMSIASLIAMAGDRVEMAGNGMLMVHAPWSVAIGNAATLRDAADTLDKWAQAMAVSYAEKTGREQDEILALLTDGVDHYYTADEAKAFGFVDDVVEALPIAAHLAKDLTATARARFARRQSEAAAQAAAGAPEKTSLAAAGAPISAAPAANPEETSMSTPNPQAAAPQPANPADIRAEVLAAETARRADIRGRFTPFAAKNPEVADLMTACLDDVTVTPEAASQKLLAKLAEGVEPVAGTRIVTIEDQRDKFRAGAKAALAARAGLQKDDTANEFRSYTLLELARAALRNAGGRPDSLSKMGVVASAFTHTGSDFPILLEDVANKAMLRGYEEASETFQRWTRAGTASDFKKVRRVDIGTFPTLSKVEEGAEYTYATVGDRGEEIQVATYGKLFSITRQAIINDDMDAFTRIPANMGRAAIRTIGDLVYAVLTSNPAMADTKALFHADHGNLLTAAALSTDSVDKMRVAMAKQKDGSAILNIRLGYLIVPVNLEGAANVVRNSEFEVGASTRSNTTPNSVRGTFEVVSDARLDATSAYNWFGAANPAVNDTIEVAYLDGVQTPTLEQESGWNVDGVEMKVRMDAGVKALDWRTLAKNPYAG